jgi:hypothetical protein
MPQKKTDDEKKQDEFDRHIEQGFKYAAQTCRNWAKHYAKMADEFEGKVPVKNDRKP